MLSLRGGVLGGLLVGCYRRIGRTVAIGCVLLAAGLLLICGRALWVTAPVLAAPATSEFSAMIERAEPLPAKYQGRPVVRPLHRSDLPARLRLTLHSEQATDLTGGETIGVRARLMPPPTASLRGGYDFTRRAWFDRIGSVATVLGEVSPVPGAPPAAPPLRARLSAHIHDAAAGSAGDIAAAFVIGDRGAIKDTDDEAMQRIGLTHLLSIGGLHLTAVVGFVLLLASRQLALSQRTALAGYVLPLAAAAGEW